MARPYQEPETDKTNGSCRVIEWTLDKEEYVKQDGDQELEQEQGAL